MTVYFVGAGSGNPEWLTIRAKQLLDTCPVCIYAGSLISPEIIELIPSSAIRYDSSGMTLTEMISVMKNYSEKGSNILRLHTGEPTLYGAICEQMNELDRLNIDYEIVPGISAFQAAAAALKSELTLPNGSQTVIISRISGNTPVPDEQELERLAVTKSTLCLYLSVHRLSEIVTRLIPYYGADCPAAVVEHASWSNERCVKGTLSTIVELASGIKRTAVIIVGHALNRACSASRLYANDFSHGYRKGNNES